MRNENIVGGNGITISLIMIGKELRNMTLLKEKAVEMIRRMPEDNMPYVISILQNLEAMSIDKDRDKQRAKAALTDILNMEKRLPDDFDLKKTEIFDR